MWLGTEKIVSGCYPRKGFSEDSYGRCGPCKGHMASLGVKVTNVTPAEGGLSGLDWR